MRKVVYVILLDIVENFYAKMPLDNKWKYAKPQAVAPKRHKKQ
jgi:hypothetical protein